MKILILSSNNGGGHNSVAAAIRESCLEHGQTADIIDAMSFLPYGWSKLGSDVHSYIYKNKPEVFRHGYRHAEKHRRQFSKGHTVRNLLDLGTAKLGRYISEQQYELVICCHVFAGLMLTDAIRHYALPVASAIVETDYTVTPGAEKCVLDWHFVPSEKQREDLIGFGVPEGRISVSGIPVRGQFRIPHTKEEARSEFGIDTQKRNILIACGSMGCGSMEEILEKLYALQSDDARFTVSVLCGTNRKLRDKLICRYEACRDIYIFDSVQDMSAMLDAADVYITKPGGISVTEAAQKKLPMVLINAVGGCEKYNMDFFVNGGGAVTADNMQELTDAAVRICENEALRHEMSEALSRIFSENDREKIYDLMMSTANIANPEEVS